MSKLSVKAGDRVRVTWEVTSKGGDEDFTGHILICDREAGVGSAYVPASCVEALKPALKVGDVIHGEDAYESLPLGAVIDGVLFRTNAGFTDQYGNDYGPRTFASPRTVAYLPEQEAA